MNYPFATFETLDKSSSFTKCIKYLQLHKFKDRDITYWVRIEDDSIRVSKETYEAIESLMIECNKKFNRANLPEFPGVQT